MVRVRMVEHVMMMSMASLVAASQGGKEIFVTSVSRT